MDDKLKKDGPDPEMGEMRSEQPLAAPHPSQSSFGTRFDPPEDRYAPAIRHSVFIGTLDIIIGAIALIFLFIKLGKARFDLYTQYILILGVIFLGYGILKVALGMLAQKNSALLSKLTAHHNASRSGSPEVRGYAMAFKVFMPLFAVALIPIGEIFSLTAFVVALGAWIVGMIVYILCRTYCSIIK